MEKKYFIIFNFTVDIDVSFQKIIINFMSSS